MSNLSTTEALDPLFHKLAAAQLAEGTWVDDNTWAWVQAFADFDYEYSYLVDVRRTADDGAQSSEYLGVFRGYDRHGVAVFRTTWQGKPATFPNVPDLYDALIWWAAWTKDTRQGEHGNGPDDPSDDSTGKVD